MHKLILYLKAAEYVHGSWARYETEADDRAAAEAMLAPLPEDTKRPFLEGVRDGSSCHIEHQDQLSHALLLTVGLRLVRLGWKKIE
jgi:hypothetical protein